MNNCQLPDDGTISDNMKKMSKEITTDKLASLFNHDWMNNTKQTEFSDPNSSMINQKSAYDILIENSSVTIMLDPKSISDVGAMQAQDEHLADVSSENMIKKAMLRGILGSDLDTFVSDRMPADEKSAFMPRLASLASEQGLMGGVYVPLNVFRTASEARAYLDSPRAKMATFVVGQPTAQQLIPNAQGHIAGKVHVANMDGVKYTPELLAKYARILGEKGDIAPGEKIASKEDLQAAFLGARRASYATDKVAEKPEGFFEQDPEVVHTAEDIEKAFATKEAGVVLDKVAAAAQESVLSGTSSRKVAGVAVTRYASESSIYAKTAGFLGSDAVDLALFSSKQAAALAIRKAKETPRFAFNGLGCAPAPWADTSAMKSLGLQPLSGINDYTQEHAGQYLDGLVGAERLSPVVSSGIKSMSETTPAFVIVAIARDEAASPANQIQYAENFCGEQTGDFGPMIDVEGLDIESILNPNKQDNAPMLVQAAEESLKAGFGVEQVTRKVAETTSVKLASSIVGQALAQVTEISADALGKCLDVKYPLAEGSTILKSDKCRSCVFNSFGVACKRQARNFSAEGAALVEVDNSEHVIEQSEMIFGAPQKRQDLDIQVVSGDPLQGSF